MSLIKYSTKVELAVLRIIELNSVSTLVELKRNNLNNAMKKQEGERERKRNE
jgi:hypothetical protein